jgi:hypothetical protein
MEAVALRARLPGFSTSQSHQGSNLQKQSRRVSCLLQPRCSTLQRILLPSSATSLRHSCAFEAGESSQGGLPLFRAVRHQRPPTVCRAVGDDSSSSDSDLIRTVSNAKSGLQLSVTEEGEVILIGGEDASGAQLGTEDGVSVSSEHAVGESAGENAEVKPSQNAEKTPAANKEFILQVHIPRPPSPEEIKQGFKKAVDTLKRNPVSSWLVSFPAAQRRRRLELLEAAADEDPKNPEKEAAYLLALNQVSPAAVIERFEKREHAADSSAVVEYLKALVNTDSITRYLPDNKEGTGATLPALVGCRYPCVFLSPLFSRWRLLLPRKVGMRTCVRQYIIASLKFTAVFGCKQGRSSQMQSGICKQRKAEESCGDNQPLSVLISC